MSIFVIALIVGGALGLLAMIGSSAQKTSDLRDSPSGSMRVETVKSNQVGQLQRRYRKHGWEVVQQSSAKSFGTKARVTLTFRKP